MSLTTIYKHLPFPAPEGLECADCDGKGVTGDQFTEAVDVPGDGGVQIVLLLDVLCPTCHGGAHPDHDPSFDPDADPGDDWMTDEEEERAEQAYDSCGSCHGRRFWLSDGFPTDEAGEVPDDADVVQLVMPCGCAEPLLIDVPAPAGV